MTELLCLSTELKAFMAVADVMRFQNQTLYLVRVEAGSHNNDL